MKIVTKLARLAAAALLALSGAATAEGWAPNGTLRFQIGFAAGGETDTMGRVIAQVMKEQTGWNIVAENKTGGGGVAMFTTVAKVPPKGHLIGMGVTMPIIVNMVTRPENVPFDLDSFDYLGTLARAQLALVARADAPFDDLAGMIAYAKAEGGLPVAFDAPPQKLLMEFVDREAEAGFRLVSTKGASEVVKLLLGGQVMVGFSAGAHLEYLASGDLKMIASANDSRHNYAPDVETFREAGYDMYLDPYFFFATTGGTDPAARDALAEAIANAVASDEVREVVNNIVRSDPLNLGPAETEAMIKDALVMGRTLFGQ